MPLQGCQFSYVKILRKGYTNHLLNEFDTPKGIFICWEINSDVMNRCGDDLFAYLEFEGQAS